MAVAHTQVNATHPRERRPRGKNAGDKRAAASDETTGPIALVSLPRLGVCVCGGGGGADPISGGFTWISP